MMKRILLYFIPLCFIISCRDVPWNVSTGNVSTWNVSMGHAIMASNLMRYAKNVMVCETDSGYLLTVRNPWDSTVDTFNGSFLRVNEPFQKVVCYSATQWSAFEQLGEVNRVKGVLEGRYVYDSLMCSLLATGAVQDVGTEAQTNTERLIALQPDLILYTPYMGVRDIPENVSDILPNTAVFPFADYLENDPLGRAEWIRVVGILCGRRAEADAWFDEVERRYLSLKTMCDSVDYRPTVFTDLPFNGQWYIAGGRSYIAQLFTDAGADYLWADNEQTGSVPIDFESILAKAQHADFWRVANSTPQVMTYATLERVNPLYPLFDAFKKHKMMVCDILSTGYFEQSSMEPDVLLADFIWFFHPELLTDEWADYQPHYYHWMP